LAEPGTACPTAMVIVLISLLEVCLQQQADLSAGADVWISKGEPRPRVFTLNGSIGLV
jgi:hypothetical protein